MHHRTVLVIGSTGILEPAALAIGDRGDGVVGISRHGHAGSIGVDARDRVALMRALEGTTWTDALVYGPAVSRSSLDFVRKSTPGRCVLIATSEAAEPSAGSAFPDSDTVLLGWSTDAEPRWHSPTEVAMMALEVLADGRGRTLGSVRPWIDRP